MALTGDELTDEVQALTGRLNDTKVVTDARTTRWLNEAQIEIARKCPGLHSLIFKNTVSFDTTQTLQWSIADITVGDSSTDEKVCHLWNVSYLDGNESVQLTFIHTDEFDAEYPDPTHSDHSPDKPTHWTRRGNYVEIYPLCACAYCNKDLRFDGGFYPREFTTNDSSVSDISGADEGLIYYAVFKAFGALGDEERATTWKKKFSNPNPVFGEEVGWLEDFQDKNDVLIEWSGNLFDDALE